MARVSSGFRRSVVGLLVGAVVFASSGAVSAAPAPGKSLVIRLPKSVVPGEVTILVGMYGKGLAMERLYTNLHPVTIKILSSA